MNPTLEEIQVAINARAKKVLKRARDHACGAARRGNSGRTTIGRTSTTRSRRDKEIVKLVLLLTGSIEGTKAQVMEYIDGSRV